MGRLGKAGPQPTVEAGFTALKHRLPPSALKVRHLTLSTSSLHLNRTDAQRRKRVVKPRRTSDRNSTSTFRFRSSLGELVDLGP